MNWTVDSREWKGKSMTDQMEARLADPGPLVTIRSERGSHQLHWGHSWQLGTAAYWVESTRDFVRHRGPGHVHRLGTDLREEVAACILGGFGMPYETALAAFEAVRTELLVSSRTPTAAEIERVLRVPRNVNGAPRHYRFPRQRAQRLAGAFQFVERAQPESFTSRQLRDWLLDAPGIGLKTASWIVRNLRNADDVAILDVHLLRAGKLAGVFPRDADVARDYRVLEQLFVAWAKHGQVSAGDLDAVIWSEEAYWARHR
jgi:N-glycosylase/DNA lyase